MDAGSYEIRLERIRALLAEWGECHRREPYPGPQGYPRSSVEGRMMHQWGQRADGTAPSRPRTAGPRQTRVHVTQRGDEWPEPVRRVDSILARLDKRTRTAVQCTYQHHMGLREVAARLCIGRSSAAALLEHARWYLLGALSEADAA